MKRLTTEQQKLVEQNHNLIYDFAKRKNLNIEEYYDILAIGLCKAAQIYNPEKGELSTIANTCMNNEMIVYYRDINKKGNVPEEIIVSGNKEIGSNNIENITIFDTISDDYNISDDVVNKVMCSSLIDSLTNKEKIVVECIMNGFTQKQISEKLNCSQQNVYHMILKIRKKCKKYLNK